MFTNADVTLYLYHKCGKDMRYIRIPVEDVYWEDVRQSTFHGYVTVTTVDGRLYGSEAVQHYELSCK